ncbi:trehalose-phosphatase [uncultured Thiodictyon sp.]|uniref:trehalose-phosphatase n=2 Tax=uncultured Thiodictyon sp. TaxID=1846217 RepID=UPI0025D6BFEC|nr:trehalose-phosphatase [uncultured Thiodictyon sp.]
MNGPTHPGPRECPGWAQDWALFLDIDGTLLDLAPEPQAVRIPPDLRSQLEVLAQGLGGALALVSGRPLSDIDRFFPGGFDAAGTHGVQWRLGGIATDPGPAVADALTGIAEWLRAGTQGLSGVLLERKPHAVALHYRLAPQREAQIQSLAARAAQTLGPDFRLQAGKLVVEILPVAAGKGAAIERFMGRPPYAGRTPVFVGDDRTDEDGFAVVNRLGGRSVRVGEGGETQARWRLASPDAVRDWLAGLVASLPRDGI